MAFKDRRFKIPPRRSIIASLRRFREGVERLNGSQSFWMPLLRSEAEELRLLALHVLQVERLMRKEG